MDPNEELLRTLLNEQLGAELDLLSQRVKAEQEVANELKRKNDLEEQALRSIERNRQAEIQKVQLWLNISEQTANLIQQLPEIKLTILGIAEQLEELQEQQLKEIDSRLDRIEYALMLLLSGVKGNRVDALIDDIENDRHQKLLEQYKTHLHALKMKLATYGKLQSPPHLQLEIEDLEKEIEKLEQRS